MVRLIVEHVAGRARALRRLAAQDLDARRLAVDRDLAPGAGKRRQAVDMAQHLARRLAPVDPRLGLVDLGGVGDAVARSACVSCSAPRSSAAIARTIRSAPSGASASCRSAAVMRVRDRQPLGHRDVAGVEAVVHLHHHHAGLGIAGHDGAVDRRGAAPARQQRGVQVEAAERRRIENRPAAGSCRRRRRRRHRRRARGIPPALPASSASSASARECRAAAPPARPGVGCSFMPRPAGFGARV